MINAVIFDFDDTIVRSERVKRDLIVEHFGFVEGGVAVASRFMASHPGANRYAVVRGVLADLHATGVIGARPTTDAVAEHLAQMGATIERAVIASPLAQGAKEALDILVERYPLHINSATPKDTLDRIVRAIGMERYFKTVLGAPPGTKQQNLEEILSRYGPDRSEVAIVGDGVGDMVLAENAGCRFVGIRGDFSSFGDESFPVLDDLSRLPEVLDRW